jgi:hypothetical protein
MNGFRVELVRHLRKQFGSRYLGGIIRNAALQSRPDIDPSLLSNIPTRRSAYASASRGPSIGVYTRGVHGSNAYKLPEYLASSKCIVGESLAHLLPESLSGIHSVAESVEQVVSECDSLLTDVKRLNEVRRASWDYYQRNIRYERRIALITSCR